MSETLWREERRGGNNRSGILYTHLLTVSTSDFDLPIVFGTLARYSRLSDNPFSKTRRILEAGMRDFDPLALPITL